MEAAWIEAVRAQVGAATNPGEQRSCANVVFRLWGFKCAVQALQMQSRLHCNVNDVFTFQHNRQEGSLGRTTA